MTTDRPRVALVGAGLIAQNVHLPRLAAREDAELAVVVDVDPARARDIAERFGAPRHATDLEAVLADDTIDVVDLCTPPTLHREQVEAALAAGKDVILEKPVATTLADARAVADAVAMARDRVVMVAENWVFSSAARTLQHLIDSGELGEVFLWESRHESDHRLPAGNQPGWNYDLGSAGGGYLTQAGTHAISLGRRLLGEVESVVAVSPQAGGDGGPFLDDEMVVGLRFRSGASGSMVLTGRSRRKGQRLLSQTLFGSTGTVDADVLSGEVVVGGCAQPPSLAASLGFDEEFDHFFACRREGRTPETSAADQVETIRTLTAIYRAAATGSRVRMDDLA